MCNPIRELSKYYCSEDSEYASVIMDTGYKLIDVAAECLQRYDYPNDELSIVDLIIDLCTVIMRIKMERNKMTIKACPFCGNVPKQHIDIIELSANEYTLSHHCPHKEGELSVCLNVYGKTKEEVVDLWNHRYSDDCPKGDENDEEKEDE